MRFFTAAIVTVSALTSCMAVAEEEWIDIAKSDEGLKWQVQSSSLEFTETEDGTAINLVNGKIINKKKNEVELYKWYVSKKDCKRKSGLVVSTDLDGKFQFENEFVIGDESIAAAMAEVVCTAAKYRKANE
ncbi:MAG: hypothetical protein V4812_08305 [Pseudomonadota bacterium]